MCIAGVSSKRGAFGRAQSLPLNLGVRLADKHMKCYNCSNQAMWLVGPEDARRPLCLDCHLKLVQATTLENDMLTREMNFLIGMAEATSGVYGAIPKYPERKVVQMGNVALNNIKIDRSSIGVLNTGTIGTLDAAPFGVLVKSRGFRFKAHRA